MADDLSWNFQNAASKPRLLAVLKAEIDEMHELVAQPERWHAPTVCPGWEVRDMVGHLIDATDNYLTAFEAARNDVLGPELVGVAGMAKASDRAARAFRSEPRDELLARLRDHTEHLMHEFELLSDPEWTDLIVPDPYMGPLPAKIIVTGLLGGYTVHGWDIRQGLGVPHALA